jgi:hypothetical protein
MWPFGEGLLTTYKSVSDLPFVQKAVSAAVGLAVVVLALGGTVHEAQAVLQTSAAVSVVIAALKGEP